MTHPTADPSERRPGIDLSWAEGFQLGPSQTPPAGSFSLTGDGYSLFYGQPDQPPPTLWDRAARERLAARANAFADWREPRPAPRSLDLPMSAYPRPLTPAEAGAQAAAHRVRKPRTRISKDLVLLVVILLGLAAFHVWSVEDDLKHGRSPMTFDLRSGEQ